LKNKRVALTLLLVGLTLMFVPLIGSTKEIEEDPGIPVIIRGHGFAITRIVLFEEDELILMPAHLVLRGLLFKPIKIGNFSIAPLAIRSGFLEINETRYNMTWGKGALVLEKHDIVLVANGTGPNGENISLRLVGKWFKLPDETIFLVRMTGVVKFEEDGKLLLTLRAIAYPRLPLPK